MLWQYRRHKRSCPHKHKGQQYWACKCPITVRGNVNGEPIREAIGLTDWQEATDFANKWVATGIRPEIEKLPPPAEAPKTIEQALEDFIGRKKSAQRLRESTLYKYRQLKAELLAFTRQRNLVLLKDLTLDTLDQFQASWKQADITCFKKLERLKAFFKFCRTRGWISTNPASDLLPPKVQPKQTLPFSRKEMQKIIAATYGYRDKSKRIGQDNAKRLRALVLLLRYAGLRIGDAVACSVDQLHGTKLHLYTQKTGQPVYCPLPQEVVTLLRSVRPLSEKHFFWTGRSKLHTAVGIWQRTLKRLFDLAGIEGGHAHRFRDTFAVELLLEGASIEEVAVLLGHSNTKVTQRHYNPWVSARQRQLEETVRRAWASDPLMSSGTQAVRGKEEQKVKLFIVGGMGMVPAGGIEPTA